VSELRVFIADDEQPARERLKELLADIAGELPTRVVGEAQDGLEVVARLPESGAQVLLLGLGALVFVVGTAIVLSLPQDVGF